MSACVPELGCDIDGNLNFFTFDHAMATNRAANVQYWHGQSKREDDTETGVKDRRNGKHQEGSVLKQQPDNQYCQADPHW